MSIDWELVNSLVIAAFIYEIIRWAIKEYL